MGKLTEKEWQERKHSKVVHFTEIYRGNGSHGKMIKCLSGRDCENLVSEKVGICRKCRRLGELRIKRLAYKERKLKREVMLRIANSKKEK